MCTMEDTLNIFQFSLEPRKNAMVLFQSSLHTGVVGVECIDLVVEILNKFRDTAVMERTGLRFACKRWCICLRIERLHIQQERKYFALRQILRVMEADTIGEQCVQRHAFLRILLSG